MPLTPTPHDALFRALVSDTNRAAVLLKEYLPTKVADIIDWDVAPEPIEGNFIDGDGARTQCDALFSMRLKTGKPVRIFALLEHKSVVDAATPLQILRYMINIWSRDEENLRKGRLIPILPVVFFHGRGEWTVPLSIPDMIDAPEDLADEVRRFRYVLHDLGRSKRIPLSSNPEVDFGLLALSLAFLRSLTPADLDRLTRGLPETGDFASLGWRYVIEVINATPDALGASLRRTKPEQLEDLMGTAAQAWLEQGKAEGEAKGRAEGEAKGRAEGEARGQTKGQIDLLLHQLERRFGQLPPEAVGRVRGGSPEEIVSWADAVLDAPDLEAVFRERDR